MRICLSGCVALLLCGLAAFVNTPSAEAKAKKPVPLNPYLQQVLNSKKQAYQDQTIKSIKIKGRSILCDGSNNCSEKKYHQTTDNPILSHEQSSGEFYFDGDYQQGAPLFGVAGIPAMQMSFFWNREDQAWLLVNPPVANYSPFCYTEILLEEGDLDSIMSMIDDAQPSPLSDIGDMRSKLNPSVRTSINSQGRSVSWSYYFDYDRKTLADGTIVTPHLPQVLHNGATYSFRVQLDHKGRIIGAVYSAKWFSFGKVSNTEKRVISMEYSQQPYVLPQLKLCS